MHGLAITALLVSPNRELADQFTRAAARTRSFEVLADLRGYPNQQTLEIRLRQLRPDVLLVDLSTDIDQACRLINLLSNATPQVLTIGLHTSNDSEVILRSLREGATEFLHAPFESAVQDAAVERLKKLTQSESGERTLGKVVVFSSCKPGSGASTLAAQTAFAVRRATGKRVLLVDFDLMGGTIGFYLRLDQTYSLLDVLQHSDRLDPNLWSSMTVTSGGIDVLPSPDTPYSDGVEPSRLHDVLQYARALYDWVIVDVPSIFHRISLLTLSESDQAFLVATSDLASLHLARKAVKLLGQLGFDTSRYQVLINRVDKRDGINGSDLGKLFECQVKGLLPNDYFSLHRVVTLGEPLEGESELGKAIEGLAVKLTGAQRPEAGPRGLLSTRPVWSES